MSLTQLGWSDTWAASFETTWRGSGFLPARVVREERGSYLLGGDGSEWLASVSGTFRHAAQSPGEFPAVGDWVAAASGTSPRA